MLQSEFIQKYTKWDPELEKKYNEAWMFAMPCDCDYELCPWWGMIRFSTLKQHIETDMKKWDKDINWINNL